MNKPIDHFTAGMQAIDRGAWKEAREQLQASVAQGATPQALEQLGLAAWWLDDAALTFDARERAYNLYRDQGNPTAAARVALWLTWDFLSFRGDAAVASGWLERARRLLAGHEHTASYGWLLARDGEQALFRGHDPAAARRNAAKAAALGRETGDRGLEFTGLALEGLARVSAGDVAGGMRCLDEATAAATAGEVKELHTVGVVCCWQIFACEQVRDYDRAAQWCAQVREFSKRWGLRPLSGVCRVQYAGILIWGGKWEEAETELAAAVTDFEQARPAMTGQALARLGELRLRQGRLDEAAQLFDQAGSQSIARIGRAAIALENGSAKEALAELQRFLAQVSAEELTIRPSALELAVRAHAALGDWKAAEAAVVDLQEIATTLGTTPLAASVAAARGTLLRARGGGDAPAAAAELEKAMRLYEQTGAPFEGARSRLELAQALASLGQGAAAAREAARALKAFESLGATRDAARARRLAGLSATGKEKASEDAALTKRQVEILRLVAQGLSNPEIATRLKLSDHTVKRHVANLLTRLSLSSRAAAAAYAAQRGLL